MSQQNSGISNTQIFWHFWFNAARGPHLLLVISYVAPHFTRPTLLQMCLTKVFLVSLCYFVHCENTRDAFVPSIQRMIDLVWRSKKRTDAALTKVDIVPCFTDSRQPASCPSVFSLPTSHPHTLFVKGDAVRGTFQNFVLAKGIPQTTTEGSSLAVNAPLIVRRNNFYWIEEIMLLRRFWAPSHFPLPCLWRRNEGRVPLHHF